jgi:hypothetical protein
MAASGVIHLWDLRGRQLAQFESSKSPIIDSSFNAKETNQLLLADHDGNLRLEQIQNIDQLLAKNCTLLKNYLYDYPEGAKICFAR